MDSRPQLKMGVFLLLPAFLALLGLAACGGGGGSVSRTTGVGQNTAGLTSIEASRLAWPKAKENFGDAVLWRMAPVKDKNSTLMTLDPGWLSNDRAPAWFIWYADADGENWLLISIQGKGIAKVDIGTRGFTPITMESSWPREAVAVSMKDAASAAAKQGANMEKLVWSEFSMDYALSETRRQPLWVFACEENLGNGGSLNYRIFVNAITGTVTGCYNERNEKMTLPIVRSSLTQTRASSHEADVRQFFKLISDGDPISAVRQLAYQASPNEAMNQMWLANFKSLKTLKIISVEPVQLESWTGEWERYKVVLDITTGEPPDKYGWDSGKNTRWITIIPQGAGPWKVSEMASSP